MPSLWQPGQLLFVGFDGTTLPRHLAEWIGAGRVGGVVLFSRNVGTVEETRALVEQIHRAAPPDVPPLVAVDQEGGRVQRLRAPWTEFPPMRIVARVGGADAAARVGRALGIECREAGIGWNFAPVVDVDTNPENPVIGDRSFARDPQTVAACGAAFVEAMQAEQVAACAKHFPGHGDTDVDSHLDLPVLRHDRARLDAVELPPFRAAVRAKVASIMTAHVVFEAVDPKRPATFSPDVLAILREEMGYDGVVVSDDLEMKAVADRVPAREMAEGALRAGVDVLLACRSRELQEVLLGRLER
ncbi:MAG: beta-N-acetylhexosaminidase, partial [Deltaproteobacteria bacterium]